jgi:hypothetical protein
MSLSVGSKSWHRVSNGTTLFCFSVQKEADVLEDAEEMAMLADTSEPGSLRCAYMILMA